jgi:uncharacterized protein (DUF305 family)
VTKHVLYALALVAIVAGCGAGDAREAKNEASTAPFDRAFIDAMVPHHRSAIQMAQTAQKAGLSQPDLIAIALAISDTQQKEIDQMLRRRKRWYGSSAIAPNAGEMLGMSTKEMGMTHSSTDITEAGDVDAAFASMMIDHHEGAVAMAKLALKRAQHSQVKGLARRIIAAQEREIKIMKPHASAMHSMHE